ncbi:MAG: ABC transporter ATP-binding protein [Aeromicrobium sp.]
MAEALVETKDVQVRYGRGRRTHVAVDGVDLTVSAGETVGLVGESGSGKSSLGNAILGMVPVSGGDVWFDGERITGATRADRRRLSRRMQVVFQDPYGSMNPARTIADTLAEPLHHTLRLSRADIDGRIEQALSDVGLETSVLRRYPGDFSGGQRQRIAIARAIALEPDFLVCDEAVSALDLSVQAQVLNVLARLRAERGLAYLFISHDLSVVRFLADRIVVMYAGRVVEQGPSTAVIDRPAHPYTQLLLSAAPVPDPAAQAVRREARRHRSVGTTLPVRAGACAFVARCPFAQQRCHDERPVLLPHQDGTAVACHRSDEIAALTLDDPVTADRS